MRLFIAEKPSLARAIADVMPKPHRKQDGYIQIANGDIVTWCIGHLLEQAPPDAYDSKYKKWQKSDLPIIPNKWELVVKPNTKKQFNIVKKLIKQADVLVNLGDPDRVTTNDLKFDSDINCYNSCYYLGFGAFLIDVNFCLKCLTVISYALTKRLVLAGLSFRVIFKINKKIL